MFELNTNEVRNLQFEVSIQGINYDELSGSLKFIIDDVEYGFPVKIFKEHVEVEVPPLNEVVAKKMSSGDIVECKLDIFGNGFYLNPWDGQFELKSPISVETKTVKSFNAEKKQKSFKATLKEEKQDTSEVVNKSISNDDKEALLEMLFKKLEEKGFRTTEDLKDNIVEHTPVAEPEPVEVKKPKKSKPSKTKLVEQKINSKFNSASRLVQSIKERRLALKEAKKIKPKQAPKVQQVQVSDDDPYALMESLGMKNKEMQERMIEKAVELGGDGDKVITNTLKKLLGVTPQQSVFEQLAAVNKNDK